MSKVTRQKQPGKRATGSVKLLLMCRNINGHLNGLSALDVLDREEAVEASFEGDMLNGEEVSIERTATCVVLTVHVAGMERPLRMPLLDYRQMWGNACWDMIEVTASNAAELLYRLTSTANWSLADEAGILPNDLLGWQEWLAPRCVVHDGGSND